MLVLRAVFNMLVRNASPRGPMCFRCLMFNLSGPCDLLFLLCFIASWTRVLVSVMVYPCILYFMKQFAICLGMVAILLLILMFSVDTRHIFNRMYLIFNPVILDRPHRCDRIAGLIEGRASWWTTSGMIGLPSPARVKRVSRQQHNRYKCIL